MAWFDLPLAELETYRPPLDEPDDLDAFWAGTLGAARAHEVVVACDPVDSGLRLIETWDVTFAGHAGAPVRGWYSRPAGVRAQLPAVVEFPGYGRGRGRPQERLTWAAAGYAHLLMDVRGQGALFGSGGDTADPVGSGPASGFVTRGIGDPATAYLTRLWTDAARAVDAVRALPGVDPARTAVVGNSQGGGLAVAAAGLVPDVAAAMPSQPFLCHVPRALAITDADPYGEITRYLATNRGAVEATLRTLRYLDTAHLGRRARAAALFAVGLRDTICPPSTVFAAYHRFGEIAGVADREIAVYPYNHHEGGEGLHTERQLAWLARRLPL